MGTAVQTVRGPLPLGSQVILDRCKPVHTSSKELATRDWRTVLTPRGIPPTGVQAHEFLRSSQALAVCQCVSTLLEVTLPLSSGARGVSNSCLPNRTLLRFTWQRECAFAAPGGAYMKRHVHWHVLYSHLPCSHPYTPHSPSFHWLSPYGLC